MPTSSRPTTGLVVLALLAVLDISWPVEAWLGVLGSSDAPPTAALILFALLGVITLASLQPARHDHRTAACLMIGSRVVSVLLVDLPAYALGAPAWVLVVTSVAILLTASGIWWTAPLLRRNRTPRPATRAAS